MSVGESTYGQMLQTSHLEDEEDFWIQEVLEEAADVYGEMNGINTGLEQTTSLSEGYTGYVLENSDLQNKIFGFEVAPVLSEDYGTGFAVRPEEESEEYDEFKEAIFEAIEREIDSF